MKNTMKALQTFWGGFGLPAYPEDNVPTGKNERDEPEAQLPYITYTVVQPGAIASASHQARVWYKDEGYTAISEKVDDILRYIGDGLSMSTDGGMLVIYTGDPVAQYQPLDRTDLKVAYLNFQLSNYQWEG